MNIKKANVIICYIAVINATWLINYISVKMNYWKIKKRKKWLEQKKILITEWLVHWYGKDCDMVTNGQWVKSGTRPLSYRVVGVKWCKEESKSSFALNRKEKELGFRKRCGRTYCSWHSSQHSTCSHPRTCQTRICKHTRLHRPTAIDASAMTGDGRHVHISLPTCSQPRWSPQPP